MSGPPMKSIDTPGCLHIPNKSARRIVFTALCCITAIIGTGLMLEILRANGMTLLEYALLILFSVTFTWISIAFWNGTIGFILQIMRIDPLSLKPQKTLFKSTQDLQENAFVKKARTAVVMPIYNEDTHRIIAGFEANIRAIIAEKNSDTFHFYLLSDTQKPELILSEQQEWQKLLLRLGPLAKHVYYRRRKNNRQRKVGNLADFCQRWGSHYDFMLVLDADSLMIKECVHQLVATMVHNPQVGLLQTVPIPVRQTTFFGRFLQFAAALNSPTLATGLAFWQTDCANYWGHNALIRMEAFIACCGLPILKGKGAFSGEILSHDFVEAALLRRKGWEVYLLANLEGSYEEVPSNLLDYATRDRRWVQGNIQHLALLHAKGFHPISRLHFLFGAVAYISTVVWLLMLGLSTVDALARSMTSQNFFSNVHQLFPDWRIAKTELIFSLLYLTAALLLLPKIFSLIVAFLHRRAQFGGGARLIMSTIMEMIFAILLAPLMMVFHSYFVLCVLVGRKVNWEPPLREGRMIPWRQAFSHTAVVGMIALAWGTVTYFYAPVFFWWLTPVLSGLLLAAPIVRYSSSMTLGRWSKRIGLFWTPSETAEVPVLRQLSMSLKQFSGDMNVPSFADSPYSPNDSEKAALLNRLPSEQWKEMPIQHFFGEDSQKKPPEKLSADLSDKEKIQNLISQPSKTPSFGRKSATIYRIEDAAREKRNCRKNQVTLE